MLYIVPTLTSDAIGSTAVFDGAGFTFNTLFLVCDNILCLSINSPEFRFMEAIPGSSEGGILSNFLALLV